MPQIWGKYINYYDIALVISEHSVVNNFPGRLEITLIVYNYGDREEGKIVQQSLQWILASAVL